MNVKDTLDSATGELKEAKISEPRSSAEVLLADVLGCSRTELAASLQKGLSLLQRKKFDRYVGRRLKHESVWQIIGKVDFWGMSFLVDKNVLVPRPETELLVKEVIQELSNRNYQLSNNIKNSNVKVSNENSGLKILDLGTGSGTIVIALASELGDCSFFASDISSRALKIAKRNAANLLSSRKVVFRKGDLFEPWNGEKFNIVCANLPYIPHEEMKYLPLDVLQHEPGLALDGGSEGIELYDRFFASLEKFLVPGGAAFCEIGKNQGRLIRGLVRKYLPEASVKILGDLAGIDRVAIINL